MRAALASTDFSDGDGGGGCDPRDLAIALLEHELAEFRLAMRRLLDSEGEEAGAAIEAAEKLCNAYDQIDREDEDERARIAYDASPVCDCGTWKGAGAAYCPECDKDALESIKDAPTNIVSLHCPF